MKRKIIHIAEFARNVCGLCARVCREGAVKTVNGKAGQRVRCKRRARSAER